MTASSSSARSVYKLHRVITGDKHAFCPGDNLRTAGDRMRSLHADSWPVVDHEALVGVVTDPNPDWRAQGHGHNPEESFVSTCMRAEVPHCHDDDDCEAALRYMIEHHLRYVPVTDHDEHYLGIIGFEELLAALAERDTALAAAAK